MELAAGVLHESALPDDILLLVLVRLRCVLAAARTSLLARRWRGLWTRLPDLAFHRVAPATVESALARFAASPAVSLIDIRLRFGHTAAQADSLLRAAAAISPAELVCKCPGSRQERHGHIELPCFHRTTSIELETLISVKPPTYGEFTALERLSLNASIVDLGTLLNRCPRLRVLSATFWFTELLTLQPVGELPALERLTLDGNIADLGAFLNRCPRLRLISITFRSVNPDSLEAALATIKAVAARGAAVSLLGIRVPSEVNTVMTPSFSVPQQGCRRKSSPSFTCLTHKARNTPMPSCPASPAPPPSRLPCITSASHGCWMASSPSLRGCPSKDASSTT